MEADALGVKEEKEGEDGEPRGSEDTMANGPRGGTLMGWPQKVQS